MGHRRNLVSYVQRALNGESDSYQGGTQRFPPSKDPGLSLAARVAAKLEEGDFRGAVRIASSDESFAPINDDTLRRLEAKHPQTHPDCSIPASHPSLSNIQVTSADIISGIQSFPAGSAGGPDGLRPQHLKDLISCRSGVGAGILVESLTRFINLILSGEVLQVVRLYFFGAWTTL
jgi:hypothetical protein